MDASYAEPLSDAVPTSYALLRLPSRAVMREKGYDSEHVYLNGSEAHPLAMWSTHSLPRGATYKMAVTALQEANRPRWGLLKARLHFSDGSYEMFARRNAAAAASFAYVGRYDPNGVYRQATMAQSQQRRGVLHVRLQPLVDVRGHHTTTTTTSGEGEGVAGTTASTAAPLRRRTFAPEVLYENCPPPLYAQPGFDFTPMSYNAFLLRPHDRPVGVRPLASSFMHSSTDYRPRAYSRVAPCADAAPRDSRHCHCSEVYQVGDYTLDLARHADVVDHRNRLTRRRVTTRQTVVPHSSIIGRRYAHEPRFASVSVAHTRTAGGDGDEGGASSSAPAQTRDGDAASASAAVAGADSATGVAASTPVAA